jgi:ribose/xylose/arabinose/galactoside ABC-type transport system permease subunit
MDRKDVDPMASAGGAQTMPGPVEPTGPAAPGEPGHAPEPGGGPLQRLGLARVTSTPEFLVGAFLLLLCLLMVIIESHFLSEINLQNLGRQSAVLAVLSIGLLFPLLVGGIDLSLSGSIAFATVVAARLVDGGSSVALAFVLAVGAVTAVGVVNGALIGLAGLSPIVVTLAAGQVLLGAALLLTSQGPVQPQDPSYGNLASWSVGPIPGLVIAALGCAVLAWVLLKRLTFGRYVYAVGGSETAAWLAGVPTAWVKVGAYTICGFFAGVAGILLSSRVGSGDATLGATIMFSAYAAVFIGGVGFGTGRGNVSGVVLGVLVLGVIANLIDLKGIDTDWQNIISGGLIVSAIVFQAVLTRTRRAALQ